MDYSKLLDALKLGPRVLLGLALATGTLTLAPPEFLAQLGLAEILGRYRGWFGATFVLTSALLASHAAVAGWGSVRGWRARRATARSLEGSLIKLSPPEKEVLAGYLSAATTTLYFEVSDGVVNGLVAKKMLYRASNVAASFTSFPYNMQPWVWEFLQDHPEVLDGASPKSRPLITRMSSFPDA